jgi:hypothetical protein
MKPEKISHPRARWHVGIRILPDGRGLLYEAFKARGEVTEADFGHVYLYSVGPFNSKEAACVFAKYGRGNPHMQTVQDTEAVLRQWKKHGFAYATDAPTVDFTKEVGG